MQLSLALFVASGAFAAAGGPVPPGSWTFTAGPVKRTVAIEAGVLRTVSLQAGEKAPVAVEGPEFRLCIGERPTIVSSESYRARPLGAGEFLCTGPGPNVRVRYIPDPAVKVVRKVLTVVCPPGAVPVLLRWIEIESCRPRQPAEYAVSARFPRLGDWGQPVYTTDFFFGVEFPAARSTTRPDGALQLREYPGVTIAPGASWTSDPGVLGCGGSHASVASAFFEYIATLSPFSPNAPRPFIYWNGFRVIKPPDRLGQGLKMIERAREMKRLTGFAFDSWTYDAGNRMYRPDGLFVPWEKDLWPRSRAALEGTGTHLGFWTSFSCIYCTPTQAWGRTQGFALQNPHAYCLAQEKYARAIEQRLVKIVTRYDMHSINFDGMHWGQGFGCNQSGHGHLVGESDEAGVYGTDAVVRRELRIFRRLRRLKPTICLDLFVCGEWASPWWLQFVDGVHTVPGDTVAAGIPSPWLRDELITVRDMQVWSEHRRHRRQFPLWAEDLYGNQVRADHLIDGIQVRGESMGARWEDEYVMALAVRGTISAYIVCCDLHVLAGTRNGLRFLGNVGNWVRANAPIYRHFALIGGDPARREPYGYVHGDGHGRALVGLRNPVIRSQTFSLSIAGDFHLNAPGPYQVTQVYPFRYTWSGVRGGVPLRIPLPGFAVALFEVRSPQRVLPNLPDGRWTVENDRISAAGPDPEIPAPGGGLRLIAPGKPGIHGRLEIPAGTRAELQVRLDLPPGTRTVRAAGRIDDAAAPAAVHFRDRGGRPKSQDAWGLMSLPPGNHTVRLDIDCPVPVRIEAWLEQHMKRRFRSTGIPAPEGLFPARTPAELRHTRRILAPVIAGHFPPLPPGDADLADLRARCIRATTGWGRIGWDRSCWEAEPTLRIGDKTYARGLGVHAPGGFEFFIDGAYRRFRAEIGLHPIPPAKRKSGWPHGSVRFVVLGDDRILFQSPVLGEKDGARTIDVDISGVHILALKVDDAGDSNFDDLGTWANARVSR
ncbi:MAG: hypothetical protein GXP31_02400 [Kiritimatiellaeota bacterium]|nr:hypothetical protein [Kiritimatiellota bacterium]